MTDGLVRGEGVEPGEDLGAVVAEDDGAVVEGLAGRAQRDGDVGEVKFRLRDQVGAQPLGLRPHRGLGATGDRQRERRRRGTIGRREVLRGPRCLLDDHVGVGAADPEGGDAGAAGAPSPRPGLGGGQQADLARLPVHVRARLLGVEGRGELAFTERHHHLDHARHPRRRLGVADVRLDRAQSQRAARSLLAIGGQQCLGLDRVAEARAGAVGLDRVHVPRRQPRIGECLADHPFLRGAVGRGEAVARAVLVDGAAAHRRQHPPAVPFGVTQALEQQQSRRPRPSRCRRRRPRRTGSGRRARGRAGG